MRIYNTEVWGFNHAIRSMRNPMNSWDKADSEFPYCDYCSLDEEKCSRCQGVGAQNGFGTIIGPNDLKLAQTLIKSGPEHMKFLRCIHVASDVDMPRYWWSEMDTYHFNTKNSCSTMHRLLNNNNPITLDMFLICEEDLDWWKTTIDKLEELRQEYKEIQRTTKDTKAMNRLLVRAKRMLPEGFQQMRTLDTNYAELRTIYFQRKNHRLKEEWADTFCAWIESLPYAKELITYTGDEKDE